MLIDETPMFRKNFVPWYDATGCCLVMILFLDGVFLFGAAGISVARKTPEFYPHIWVPVLLMAASGGVMLSMACRLVRRYMDRIRPI